MQDLKHYPNLIKHMAPNRPSVAEKASSREWVRMRLGETYLIAAEAAGRKGDYDLAATYVNKVRERAAWHEGEVKAPQFYTIEGGVMIRIVHTMRLRSLRLNCVIRILWNLCWTNGDGNCLVRLVVGKIWCVPRSSMNG